MGHALTLSVTHSLRRRLAPDRFTQLQRALTTIDAECSVSLGVADDGQSWSMKIMKAGGVLAACIPPDSQTEAAFAKRVRDLLNVQPRSRFSRPGLDEASRLARLQAVEARQKATTAAMYVARLRVHGRLALFARET